MTNLLMILLLLFVSLAILVMLVERFGKPTSPEQQQKLSRVAMILLSILLVGGLLRHYFGG